MGLYDYMNDPANQGILAMASGLMQAGGASPYPVGLGQGLGQGIQQGLNTFRQAQAAQQQAALQDQRIRAAKEQADFNSEMSPMLQNPGGYSPDVIEKVGMRAGITGHPGAATLMTIATRMREKQEADKTFAQFKSGEDNAGLFGGLVDSPYVGKEAKALQARLDQSPSGNPRDWAQRYEHLQRFHLQALEADKRRDDPLVPVMENGRSIYRRRSQAEGMTPAQPSLSGAGTLSEAAMTMAAEQFLAGDSTAVQGFARNAAMKAALTNKIAEVAKAAGMNGRDIAAKVAEFQGIKAGERTLGTRTAQIEMAVTEAQNIMPIALDASNKVDRTNYPTINSILQAAQKGTGDENVVRLASATNALINIYSRAISPTGTPTVSDKDHAREIIDRAYSKGQYAAVVNLMQQEMAAARKSPGQVREEMGRSISRRNAETPKGRPPLSSFQQ